LTQNRGNADRNVMEEMPTSILSASSRTRRASYHGPGDMCRKDDRLFRATVTRALRAPSVVAAGRGLRAEERGRQGGRVRAREGEPGGLYNGMRV
jgi:hypothetical protein